MVGSTAPTNNSLAQSMWARYMKSTKGNDILFGRVPIRKKSISHQDISFLFFSQLQY